ncbi:hypothetical protein NBRC13719_18820 [Bacillus subtilis subsp. subtilis]|nr:hypothetical protein NBRC13719_18820 [Bacillus subtilis subsp. subtilis]
MLQKVNRSSDAVFGSVISGRPSELKDVENMVGLFINTIPIRAQEVHRTSRNHNDLADIFSIQSFDRAK